MDRFPKITLPSSVKSGIRLTESRISSLDTDDFINKELWTPSAYLLRRSGKMLRPALVFLGAQYAGYKQVEQFVDLATSMELLHVSSLIHDDILDDDKKRRGVASVHTKFGRERAILAGDALIAKAIEISAKYGEDVIKETSRAAMQMCAGEILDYQLQKDSIAPDLEQYLNIAGLKSASLIGAAAAMPLTFKGVEESKSMMKFGHAFGIAFQIRDDVFDFVEGGDKTKSRPNVVRSVLGRSGDRKKALNRAVELNHIYIDMALDKIARGNKGSIFRKYADCIRLEDDF